jgi:hypothetical protein
MTKDGAARPQTSRDHLRAAAIDILSSRGLGLHDIRDVRDRILSDSRAEAFSLLVGEYQLGSSEAKVVLDYLDPALKGRPLRFEEISPSEIVFPVGEAAEDPCDALEIGPLYFARRGLTVGQMVPVTTIVSGDLASQRTDKVWFDGAMLDPSRLSQVWRVLPV